MSKRTVFMCVLGTLVIVGLVAGLFTNNIEKSLGVTPSGTITTSSQGKASVPNTLTPTRTSQAKTTGGQPNTNPNQQNNANNANTSPALVTDTFQRTNQAHWGTASDGHNWERDANTQPQFSINGATGQITGGDGALDAIIGDPTPNVDVTVTGMINVFDNNNNFGVVLRWIDPNNWYKAYIDGKSLTILKTINGKASIIQQTAIPAKAGVAQTIRFRALGTTLFAKTWQSNTPEPQDWAMVVDDHALTNGQFGIRVIVDPATTVTIMSFNATIASMSNDT